MIIYKVRILDELGKEVGEFGFYEDQEDARRRLLEILPKVNPKFNPEIREISIIPSTCATEKAQELSKKGEDFYEPK